jgi:hypothetical protein
LALAGFAGWMDWRRNNREELDRVGWANWQLIMMAGLIGGLLAGLIAAAY